MKKSLQRAVTAAVTMAAGAIPLTSAGETHLLNSDNVSVMVTTNDHGAAYYQYIGPKLQQSDIDGMLGIITNATSHTLPQFGLGSTGETILSVKMPDGTVSTDLAMTDMSRTTDARGELLTLTFKDNVYPLTVKQFLRRYADTDVFSTWTEITNTGKKGDMTLLNYGSASLPVIRDNNYLTQFHGGWANERQMYETPLPTGQSVIDNKQLPQSAFNSDPGFMISVGGKATENSGDVFAATLQWSGCHRSKINVDNWWVNVQSGIDNDNAPLLLKPGESFTTPELLFTYSKEGKGGASRAFHRWGRKFGMAHGDRLRDVLLNSWEGVYFDINQEVMDQMMADIASLGGELFVMDDGWFGDKYPRDNDTSSLGDWMVNRRKLPDGIKGLTDAAKKHGIKFGIWIEPEMANTTSELYEKHPDWILSQPNRPLLKGRGGTQVILDMTNPAVQDYVVEVVDNIMKEAPEIKYIKWDCNSNIMNYASSYLPKERQSELTVRWQEGVYKALDRVRAKYPDLTIQLCAGGGGRSTYGMLPWFDEFWTSDNTDALQRIYIQWGASQFYPAIAQASHVSASPNHQTQREVPLKFRFDVAMSGRLGMEIQPKNMTAEELEFSKRAIASYKKVRDIVQMGDQYRLVSPYDNRGVASVMYATPAKDRAVVYAYRTEYLHGRPIPFIHLDGVDENRNYRIHDLTPWKADNKCFLDGKVVSGRVLKSTGLNLNGILNYPMSSLALELVAE